MRTSTFATIGTDVSRETNLDGVLKASGLDYNVITEPIFYNADTAGSSQLVVPNRVLTMREDTRTPIGVVSDTYNVCQNRDAFDFIDAIHDDIKFVKAGETGSHLIYIIAKLNNVKILGDEITPYVIFQNSHTGLGSIKATITPLRIVCQNQFNISFKRSPNTVRIVHSMSMDSKLAQAREMLGDVASYMKEFDEQANELATMHVQDKDAVAAFYRVFKYDPAKMTERQKVTFDDKLMKFLAAYKADDNQNFVGTAWGILNGAADYLTHSTHPRAPQDSKFVDVSINSTLLSQFYSALTMAR